MCIRLSLGLVLALVASGCVERPTQPIGGSAEATGQRAAWAQSPSDYVTTPAGLYHRSCVHEVPNGSRSGPGGLVRRADGTTYQIPKCQYPAYPDWPALRGVQRGASGPYTNGWKLFAYNSLLGQQDSYTFIEAIWKVPPAPVATYNDVCSPYCPVYYAFTGLQGSTYILQPVIAYGFSPYGGGNYWTLATWECGSTDASCTYSTPITVSPGDSIAGYVQGANCYQGSCNGWLVAATDLNTGQGTDRAWSNDLGRYWYAAPGVVETYGLSSCDEYPNSGVFFHLTQVEDWYGVVSPTWRDTVQAGADPNCSFAVTSTADSVYLFENPVPPPPLEDAIYAQPPTYTAEPSGGYPPYTYYWEYCISNCSGGAAPSVGAQVSPNLPSQGWQFLSTSRSVSWSGGQAYLRNTVTDSHSQQAQAEIQVNGS